MAFTPNDIIALARDTLQDTVDGPYRHPTDSLIRALNLAIPEASRVRPDLFYDAPSTLPVVTSLNLSASLGIDDRYKMPFVMFLAGFASLKEDQFTNDSRAGALLARFSAQLVGVV